MVMANPFGGDAPIREDVRFLAELTPEHRRRALAPGGLPLPELTAAEQRSFLRVWDARARSAGRWGGDPTGPPDIEHGHFIVEYVPSGWYVWTPPAPAGFTWGPELHRVVARTAAEALTGARRIYPSASADQVTFCKAGE